MKLSELIAYRNALDRLSIDHARRSVELGLGEYLNLVDSTTLQVGNYQQQLHSTYDTVHKTLDQFQATIQGLRQEVQSVIEELEREWFQESYRLYDVEMRNDTPDYILNRRPVLLEDTDIQIRARLQHYADWRLPGLVIRPGLETFTQELVMFDPLYIVDTDQELLNPIMAEFPVEYQRRLRPYVVHEIPDQPILTKIPNGQFGVCLVYNFFEYRPFEVIKTYLEEIYQKLRPGGTLMLTINDCDNDKAVRLVEQHYKCYTPGNMVKRFAETVGYTVTYSWNDDGPSTWIELRKPGLLTSTRGGQVLAKVQGRYISPVERAKIEKINNMLSRAVQLGFEQNPNVEYTEQEANNILTEYERRWAEAKRIKREAKARRNLP